MSTALSIMVGGLAIFSSVAIVYLALFLPTEKASAQSPSQVFIIFIRKSLDLGDQDSSGFLSESLSLSE
jgi:hypothetical protein